MGLRYIFGKPGTGKTSLCMKELISLNKKGGNDNLIYIVPEQFTLQSEKELINKSPQKAIMQAQVLSFQRLSYHVFNEAGGSEKKILEDIGKSMLLRKIINELRNDLSFFSTASDKQGFMEQLFDTITEFYQYNVSTERLNDIISSIRNNETLRLKMIDLYKILEKYKNYQTDNYILNDEKLDILAEKIENSSLIKNSIIWIDGFNGFTPQEYKVIGKLLLTSKHISITMSIDYNKAIKSKNNGPDSFFEIKYTINKINKIVSENNIPIEKAVSLDTVYRLKDSPEIRHLEENYLLINPEQYLEDVSSIKICPCDNIYAEIENTAAEILSIVRDKGYKFNDIGILACSLDDYGKNIESVFQKYNIPVFIDIKSDIMSHPLIELIRSAFSIITDNWSYESVFRFLKTNLTSLKTNDIDIIENYVLSYGIKGGKWKKAWEYGFNTRYEIFEKEHINNIREDILYTLCPLADKYKTNKKYTVKELSAQLFLFLESLNIGQTINEWTQRRISAGNFQTAKEYAQIWGKLIQVLDKIVEILGEEKVTIEEYSKIIDAGFSESDLGIIPPSLDQIIVADLRRSRMPDIKVLFVLGINEGILPSKFSDMGLLSDEERIFLEKNHNTRLMPNSLLKAHEEKFLTYMVLSKPSDLIFFSYSLGGLDGKASSPSPIIKKIKEIFPRLTVGQKDSINCLASKRFAYNEFLLKLRSFFESENIPLFYKDIYSFLLCDKNYNYRIKKITKDYFDTNKEVLLEKSALNKLYGNNIRTSVSRLEKYIKCPFSYFAQYNLMASERKLYEIQSVNLGNLFHDVLDGFSKRIQSQNINWREAEVEEIYNIASDCINDSLLKESNEIFKNSPQYEFFADRARQIAMRSILVIIEHMRSGEFDFTYSEAVFNDNNENQLGAIKVDLGDGIIMYLEGRIDRVDLLAIGENRYVKIIDYKSGNKVFSFPEIFYGLQLQLIVYLDAFIKKYKERIAENEGSAILPAAVLYFRLDNPLINFADISQKDNLESALYKKFKMTGVVLEEIDIIQKIDGNFESKSDIIPVSVKSSGIYKKLPFNERPLSETSSVLSSSDFQKLMNFSFDKVTETGKKIIAGEISAKPFKYGNLTGCSYCPYKPVCRFDPILNSKDYNILNTLKSKQAIQEIFKKSIDKR